MKPTDTNEKELERLIVRHLAGISEHPPTDSNAVGEAAAVSCLTSDLRESQTQKAQPERSG